MKKISIQEIPVAYYCSSTTGYLVRAIERTDFYKESLILTEEELLSWYNEIVEKLDDIVDSYCLMVILCLCKNFPLTKGCLLEKICFGDNKHFGSYQFCIWDVFKDKLLEYPEIKNVFEFIKFIQDENLYVYYHKGNTTTGPIFDINAYLYSFAIQKEIIK